MMEKDKRREGRREREVMRAERGVEVKMNKREKREREREKMAIRGDERVEEVTGGNEDKTVAMESG